MAQPNHLIRSVLLNSMLSSPGREPIILPTQGLPEISTQTFVGIIVAISGNVLISFALNLQKLAHKRTQQKRRQIAQSLAKQDGHANHTLPEESSEEEEQSRPHHQGEGVPSTATLVETEPLIVQPPVLARDYGAVVSTPDGTGSNTVVDLRHKHRTILSRLVPFKLRNKQVSATVTAMPIDVMTEESALHGLSPRDKKNVSLYDDSMEDHEGDYLKSNIWWLGFLLMNVGEVGNFISYAFAPASVVAPLGTFALIANCFFAPIMLREQFRSRDLVGVFIAIIGAITVVLASNASDTRLDADGLIHAIQQIPFIVFSIVYVVGAVVLAGLSASRFGRRWAVVDVGLCALFGGFTVLSTKALSTLLTIHWLEIFAQWITYPLLFVLISTGVGQIRYLNRALMRFDSKLVIPIQFVLFTLSAIIGSAILYGDFKKARFHQVVTFLYGCVATFAGVFIIAWAPNPSDPSSDATEATVTPEAAPGSPGAPRLGLGTVGRRRRATLVLPSGVNGVRDSGSVRRKHSAISMGLSPAQHLLLVHTPPLTPAMPLARSAEDDTADTDTELGVSSPDSYRRPRTMSWYGNDSGAGSRTRDSSLATGRQNGYGRVGSLESGYSPGR